MNKKRLNLLLRGYSILLLCLFIFLMWSINLFSISQLETQVSMPDYENMNLKPVSRTTNMQIRARPFLSFYLSELGFDVVLTPDIPDSPDSIFIIVDPPQLLGRELYADAFRWMRAGGTLAVFNSFQTIMDTPAGVQHTKASHVNNIKKFEISWMDEVNKLSPSNTGFKRIDGASFYAPFDDPDKASVLFSHRGEGSMVLVSHPELVNGQGLLKEDNLVFITRLIEHYSKGQRIYFFDPDPDLRITGRAIRKVYVPKEKIEEVKEDDLSLWSIIRANPVSWVLLQMIVAIGIFFISISKRFGRPRPMPHTDSQVKSYIQNLGQLMAEQNDANFALEKIYEDFKKPVIKKYGLKSAINFRDLVNAIRTSDPEVAQRLNMIKKDLNSVYIGDKKSYYKLLSLVKTIEIARKELKLYD